MYGMTPSDVADLTMREAYEFVSQRDRFFPMPVALAQREA